MTWKVFKQSIDSTLRITVMMFMILTGSTAFSQILAFTGASRGLVELVVGFEFPGIFIIVVMQIFDDHFGHFHGAGIHHDDYFPHFHAIGKSFGF